MVRVNKLPPEDTQIIEILPIFLEGDTFPVFAVECSAICTYGYKRAFLLEHFLKLFYLILVIAITGKHIQTFKRKTDIQKKR